MYYSNELVEFSNTCNHNLCAYSSVSLVFDKLTKLKCIFYKNWSTIFRFQNSEIFKTFCFRLKEFVTKLFNRSIEKKINTLIRIFNPILNLNLIMYKLFCVSRVFKIFSAFMICQKQIDSEIDYLKISCVCVDRIRKSKFLNAI